MAREQNLGIVTSAAGLRAAKQGIPSVILAAEGADFLEGHLERVDDAYSRWSLRHLQLTHYRVNELGDIQPEAPEHFGLTDFGAAVVRRCNNLGIVVDVAHGTYEVVKRVASVTTKPLVLSHTSLQTVPPPYSRRISREHARMIASTGGVIGVWPPAGEFGTLAALATGMARLADVVGIDHVGLGSDMRGSGRPQRLSELRPASWIGYRIAWHRLQRRGHGQASWGKLRTGICRFDVMISARNEDLKCFGSAARWPL